MKADEDEDEDDEAWALANYSSGNENRVREVLVDLGDNAPDDNAFWMANISTRALQEELQKLIDKREKKKSRARSVKAKKKPLDLTVAVRQGIRVLRDLMLKNPPAGISRDDIVDFFARHLETLEKQLVELLRTHLDGHVVGDAGNHLRAIAQRTVNADEGFLDLLAQRGFGRADALRIFEVYKREKVIKLDAVHARWTVKHGAFLDKDALDRALATTTQSAPDQRSRQTKKRRSAG